MVGDLELAVVSMDQTMVTQNWNYHSRGTNLLQHYMEDIPMHQCHSKLLLWHRSSPEEGTCNIT